MTAPDCTLEAVIEHLRPRLDRALPIKARIRCWWAAAKAARSIAEPSAIETAFMALARDTSLIIGRHGTEDAGHVLSWALRGWNPFEVGPLK